MANYFVSSTGSNTAPYDTWAKAATTFATAVAAANASGDVIAVDAASPPADVAANTTWTFVANCSVIASTNSGTSTITPTTMGTTAWLGGVGNFSIIFAGAFRVYMYGITARIGGSSNLTIQINTTDGGHFDLESCYIWQGNTNTSSRIVFGSGTAGANYFNSLKDCTFRFGATGHTVSVGGALQIVGGSVSSAGSAPTSLFGASNNTASVKLLGVDLSHVTGTLVASQSSSSATFEFSQCKLGSGVVILASQTPANKGSGRAFVFDCASGDTHGLFGYYDAFGSVVSDTGIYFTSGAAAQSWKIVTTANCSYYTPFESPWFGYYNTVTTAITPYVEILRDGSTTAYQDDEVWLDVMAKTNTGSTQSALTTDRMTLLGTPANQDAGAGLGSWTGEAGTAWSGKLAVASQTPAEVGDIQARIVVGEPSITVYADPYIRT